MEKMSARSADIEFFGLDVPPEFPILEYADYRARGKEVIGNNEEAQTEFLRGTKATVYRFLAFKELLANMEENWEALELYPGHREIFEQERDLLCLFVFGVSAIESAYYSLYILATQANPNVLDFNNLEERKKGSDPARIKSRIKSALGDTPLVASIKSVERSRIWQEWNKYRNQMFHSVAAPRVHRLSFSRNPPKTDILDYGATWCTPELLKNTGSFREYLPWLACKLARLMGDGAKVERVV